MDIIDIGRYLGALLLVLGLAAMAMAGSKRFGFLKFMNVTGITGVKADRRLQLVESINVSPRQKLLLVRRDGVEHLIAVGPERVSVIERGIAAKDQTAEQPS